MKRIMVMALGFLMILVGVSQAAPMFVDNYLHPLDINPDQRGIDIIGGNPPFEIYGYDIFGGGSQIRIYTDWNLGLTGTYNGARLGDVFIYTNQGIVAVALRDHSYTASNGNFIDEGSFSAGDVFRATSFRTSDYYFDPVFGLVGKASYGQYGDHEIVLANAGDLLPFKAAVSNFWGGIGNSYIDIVFDQAYFGEMLYVSFTQTCANDVMKVPEPGMLILLGSGILGLGIVARRRKP